jgi:hypothetical protein
MKTDEELITSNADLIQLVKDGLFFNFCVAFALNKGHRDAMKKEESELSFSVGDYEVKFDKKQMCFILIHKIYFARIITAYYQEVVFIGNNEDEVIADLLIEVEKELKIQTP